MAKARIQNIPLNSPKSIDVLNTDFKTIRMTNNPTKIYINAFERFIYISFSLISNDEVLINRIEKSIPTTTASKTSSGVTRNIGWTNISAPVLMKTGGNIIFLTEAGFWADFALRKVTKIAIIIATMEDAITK